MVIHLFFILLIIIKDTDDELGKKRAMGLEEWILGLKMNFLLGGIVKEVINRRIWEVSALLLLHL